MSSEEVSTEDSVDSLSEVSSLDDDFAKMHFESASSDEEVTDNEVDSNVWSEIESESDDECLEDYVKWYQKQSLDKYKYCKYKYKYVYFTTCTCTCTCT